jgi:hypothetical protein
LSCPGERVARSVGYIAAAASPGAGVAAFIVGVLVGVAVSLVLDRLRRQCKQT